MDCPVCGIKFDDPISYAFWEHCVACGITVDDHRAMEYTCVCGHNVKFGGAVTSLKDDFVKHLEVCLYDFKKMAVSRALEQF